MHDACTDLFVIVFHQEGTHYTLERADSEHNKCVTGVVITGSRKQYIKYIAPTLKLNLSRAEVGVKMTRTM